MARNLNGTWAPSPNEQGQLLLTLASGKTLAIDCPAVVGGKKVWDSIDPSGRWIVGYGAKQYALDFAASASGQEWIDKVQERIDLMHNLQAGSDSLPWLCEAIARIKKLPVEKVREQIYGRDKDGKQQSTAEQRQRWYREEVVKAQVTLIMNERQSARAKELLERSGASSLPEFK